MTHNSSAVNILRSDYQPLAWTVERVDLRFHLDATATVVTNHMTFVRNPDVPNGPVRLWGDPATRISVCANGQPAALREVNGVLEVGVEESSDSSFRLEVITHVNPQANTALSGLYLSQGGFFTQCEAEGFRRITYFPDRPDVMACFTVTLEAPSEACPILLSNGNLVDRGTLTGHKGWHYARWEDPYPKPSYLFALVAARLMPIERRVKTESGRDVLLQVWVEEGNLDRATFALDVLVDALRWDEETFGLELDLDRFMIVAVSDFNMGAMENKGLNIFNAKYVLAKPETATDFDYAGIEGVVAHEYFHNWTGNRVTCRDWFQLTLKEGLTVFRDQQFSADMLARAAGPQGAASARAVKRIADVVRLRATQFPEDSGPMAHPIRPESYQGINNFYTATVYEKGAEVVRMLHTFLGVEGFRQGMDLYFNRHDGQAVTCDDFVAAMADANDVDLSQFLLWYSQAGTPRVTARGIWKPEKKNYVLHLTQTTLPTPGQALKQPLLMPIAVGLIGPDGEDLPLKLEDESEEASVSTKVLVFGKTSQTFTFTDIEVDPVPSILRQFSAPVILDLEELDSRLAFRMAHDSDPFNRWDAASRYSERIILALAEDPECGVPEAYITAFYALLVDQSLDPAFRAGALTLPSEAYLLQKMTPSDPAALRAAIISLTRKLGATLAIDWLRLTLSLWDNGPYRYHPTDAGRRALSNLALRYLVAGGDPHSISVAISRFSSANNMTGLMGAINALMTTSGPARDAVLITFRKRHDRDALTLDKWFAIQASAWRWDKKSPPTLERVIELMNDPAFSLSNPNKVYALLGSFFRGNPAEFHAPSGAGYAFWARQVIALDEVNPQVAARMARALEGWRSYTPELQTLIHAQLVSVRERTTLSTDVAEIIEKALA